MKIITGGVGKAQVADALKPLLGPGDSVVASSDMDAALKLRTKQADYYIGTCHTGAGASLGVLLGMLGSPKCHTFGRTIPTTAETEKQIDNGVVAFGFCVDHVDDAVPALWAALNNKRKG